MATPTDKSEQEILNALNSTADHAYSEQEVVNMFVGRGQHAGSVQDAINAYKSN